MEHPACTHARTRANTHTHTHTHIHKIARACIYIIMPED